VHSVLFFCKKIVSFKHMALYMYMCIKGIDCALVSTMFLLDFGTVSCEFCKLQCI
jgi:hypothetical protein